MNSKSSNSLSNKKLLNLFSELGSEERLEAILNRFYLKMAQDLMLGFFFAGRDLDPIVHQQKSFLLRAMGQRKTYKGKSPGSAHRKIPPILKGHFDRRLVLLRDVLSAEKLSHDGIKTWVAFEESFRKSVVEEEAPLSKRRPK